MKAKTKAKSAGNSERGRHQTNGHAAARSTASERPETTLRIGPFEDEIEFIRAMENYQKANARPSPTWSEVLDVVHGLGYRKRVSSPRSTAKGSMEMLYRKLREERDSLHRELVELRKECREYQRAVGALMAEREPPIEYTKKELLAMAGKQQPFEEFIAELEAQFK